MHIQSDINIQLAYDINNNNNKFLHSCDIN